jgi:hypothetical protein
MIACNFFSVVDTIGTQKTLKPGTRWPEEMLPIGFSIPESRIRIGVSDKTKWISNLIPGQPCTYIYMKEADYYAEYATSVFAITCKKGGWGLLDILCSNVKRKLMQASLKATAKQPSLKATAKQPSLKATAKQPSLKATAKQPSLKATAKQPSL